MNRVLLILVLLFLAPQIHAHAEESSTGIYLTKPDRPAIAFQVYKFKIQSESAQGFEEAFMHQPIPFGFGSNIAESVLIWVTSKAIETVVKNAKDVTCPAVENGEVTVSLTLNADVSALVFGAGATGGLAVTFKCEDKKAI